MVAPDLRGHGLSQAGDEADLAAATLAADVVAIWQAMFGAGTGACSSGEGSGGAAPEQAAQQAQRQDPQPGLQEQMARQGPASPPPTVLVGHSMGGAVAVHTAALGGAPGRGAGRCSLGRAFQRVCLPALPSGPLRWARGFMHGGSHAACCCRRRSCPVGPLLKAPRARCRALPRMKAARATRRACAPRRRSAGISSLAGAVVIDVVEGTAIASLPFMEGVLAKRPRRFASLAQAVGWALDTGKLRAQQQGGGARRGGGGRPGAVATRECA